MADVRLAPQDLSRSGITPTYTAIATGNTYQVANNGNVMLHFKKSGAGNATITFITPVTTGGLAVADPTITVPASTGDVMVKDFPPGLFNDTNGDLEFTTDEGTGLTCAVIRG